MSIPSHPKKDSTPRCPFPLPFKGRQKALSPFFSLSLSLSLSPFFSLSLSLSSLLLMPHHARRGSNNAELRGEGARTENDSYFPKGFVNRKDLRRRRRRGESSRTEVSSRKAETIFLKERYVGFCRTRRSVYWKVPVPQIFSDLPVVSLPSGCPSYVLVGFLLLSLPSLSLRSRQEFE